MSIFKYTDDEKEINKVLKMNQIKSEEIGIDMVQSRKVADDNILKSEELLKKLKVDIQKNNGHSKNNIKERNIKPVIPEWEVLLSDAENYFAEPVELEDILNQNEINNAFQELDNINSKFSKKTSIMNKMDLSFLSVAIALIVIKQVGFIKISKKFDYGNSFDPDERWAHNDTRIEDKHKRDNDNFKNKNIKKHGKNYWINIIYQTPPYDITKGSPAIGVNMGGKYHRMYTLGHDPILGWIFGTANILTDIITLNDFRCFRVERKPTMRITQNQVSPITLFEESIEMIKADYFNLPAALFAQAKHYDSDVFTKQGLPIPLINSFSEEFASKLYREHYDLLCLQRDMKITGISTIASILIDILIILIHGLFKDEDISRDLYEVRTRKILLIAHSIATSSNIIATCVTNNLKNLDIGELIVTMVHLFSDVRFMMRIKQEFIENEINQQLQKELNDLDELYNSFF